MWTTTTATARRASSTTAATCCSSASTATPAPSTRSTWAIPTKPGKAQGAGFNLNLPLAAGSPVDAWFDALDAGLGRIRSFGADALVVSLGLDTYAGDPISTFQLLAHDYLRLGQRLARLGMPTVFILEGGYAAADLGVNAVNVVEGFEAG